MSEACEKTKFSSQKHTIQYLLSNEEDNDRPLKKFRRTNEGIAGKVKKQIFPWQKPSHKPFTFLTDETIFQPFAKEMELMKEQTIYWFANETQGLDGYTCMWIYNCGRKIKGRGNFKKHLDWHIKQVEENWERLTLNQNEWNRIKGRDVGILHNIPTNSNNTQT